MACPHVSGVAALLVSYFGGQGYTADMLKEQLLEGASSSHVPSDAQIGRYLDAYGSFSYGKSDPPEMVPDYTVSVKSNRLTFRWEVTSSASGAKAAGYRLLASKTLSDITGIDPTNMSSGIKYLNVSTQGHKKGDEMTASLEDLDFETPYYVSVIGYDHARDYSPLSPVKETVTLKNNPPLISTDYTGSFKIGAYQYLTVPFSIEDPDGHAVSSTFSGGSPGVSCATTTATSAGKETSSIDLTVTFNAAVCDEGDFTAVITAKDRYGATSTLSIPYTIMPDLPPVVTAPIPDRLISTPGQKFTINLGEYISDPDEETLSWTSDNTDNKVAFLNISDGTGYVTALNYGLSKITVTGVDGKNKKCSSTFNVLVRAADVSAEAFPNPVTDTLHIRTGVVPASTRVRLASDSGTVVYDATSMIGAFQPGAVDMTSCAPGVYSLTVNFGGTEYRRTIVKK